ncbi:MAG: LysR family transcriptional regulator [Myxococcota bacterium]
MDASIEDWQLVATAWRKGSFTAAAMALRVGQATVSRRVGALESRIGHRLFDRHKTGLVATEALRSLRPQLMALESASVELHRALDGLEQDVSGVVRIAGPPGLCVDWIPRLAEAVRNEHPDVTLTVLADIEPRDLVRRDADLALRYSSTPHGDLLVRRIATVQTGLFASPALLARLPSPLNLADVPLVQWADDLADIPMGRALAALGGPIAATANDYLVLRALVLAGIGACLFEVQTAQRLGLVPVPVDPPDVPAQSLFRVVHRAVRHVPRVAAVIEIVDRLARVS